MADALDRHGRDHKLRLWRLTPADEESLLDKTLPVDQKARATSAQPWLVHSLLVNALNFCAFSLCFAVPATLGLDRSSSSGTSDPNPKSSQECYIAVPNALNSGAIDVFHLPSEKRVSTISADTTVQTGMVMAVEIFIVPMRPEELYVVSGYEDGHVMVHARHPPSATGSSSWQWEKLYATRPHSQPVLSLDVLSSPEEGYSFLTSSADALIVKHPVPLLGMELVKSGDDNPLQVLNTKHAGQQGLRVRSDQKIFATAGWDARVRVYSCKTMKELAVLKWHKEGCYSVAFADVLSSDEAEGSHSMSIPDNNTPDATSAAAVESRAGAPVHASLKAIQNQRRQKTQETHWLAGGSKDGKISLWEIY